MFVVGCDGIVISGNQIKDSALQAIDVHGSTGVSVVGNTISRAGLAGINVSADSVSLEVLDNVIAKARNTGIWIAGSALCKGNAISQCSFNGLVIAGDDSSVIENVITQSGRVGLILAAGSESNTLTGNTVTGSRAFDLQDLSGGVNVLGDNTIGTTAP
jgi:parallel beta-helix repeat protein